LNILRMFEKVTVRFEEIIMIAVGLLLPSIVTVGVFFRYVLKTDLYAIEEIEIFLAIWFYFMGAAYCSYKGTHITADILQAMTKSFKLRKAYALVATGLSLVISVVFTYWCTDMIVYAWEKTPTTAVWKIPLFAQYLAVYFSMILMSIYTLRDFVRACRRRPEPDDSEMKCGRCPDIEENPANG
jgi:TRAP-type C4-dicarboxylate transport system permease small subunit